MVRERTTDVDRVTGIMANPLESKLGIAVTNEK